MRREEIYNGEALHRNGAGWSMGDQNSLCFRTVEK
jgi:hypothetical protein